MITCIPWVSSTTTFPTPPGFDAGSLDLSKLEPLAQAVLDTRAAHPTATLAELYDPDLMPPNLRRAHQALDRAVDRLYRPGGFASERQRVEHLFMPVRKDADTIEGDKTKKDQDSEKVSRKLQHNEGRGGFFQESAASFRPKPLIRNVASFADLLPLAPFPYLLPL